VKQSRFSLDRFIPAVEEGLLSRFAPCNDTTDKDRWDFPVLYKDAGLENPAYRGFVKSAA
jgi:hypothetical protein